MILPTEALSHSGVYPDEFTQMRAFTCASPNTLVARTRFTFTVCFLKFNFEYIMFCWPNVFFEHSSVCYCSMATLGTWIQCEIAESLCNPNMIKNGRMGPSTTWNGEAVDRVQWFESLVIASTRYQVLVKQGTATPVQYNTSFIQHGKQIVSRPSPLFFFLLFFLFGVMCRGGSCHHENSTTPCII